MTQYVGSMTANKRRRKQHSLGSAETWIYGRHAVIAALANPRRGYRRLIVTEEAAAEIDLGTDNKAEIWPRADLDRLLPSGAVHQGVAGAFDPLPETTLDDVLVDLGDARDGAIVVLDQVTDPRNVGAILRSTAGFGGAAVIVQDRHSPSLSGPLLKSASGAAETVPLVRAINLARTIEALKGAGFWIIGLDASGDENLGSAELDGRIALVFGAEGRGLRRLIRDRCDRLVRIEINETMKSLNVSATAAIALYEWYRQK